MPVKLLALCLMMSTLQAQGLDQVKARLNALSGQSPLVVRAESHTWSRELKKGAEPEQGWTRARLESGPAGLQLVPASESASDPSKHFPQRDLALVFEASKELSKYLTRGHLESETPEAFQGQAARRLHFTLPLEEEEGAGEKPETRKHLKEAWRTFDLWVGVDGTPLASKEAFRIRGRVMFISFEAEAKIRREYRKVGDRLLMVLDEKEARGSGMGQGSEGRTLLTVTP